MITVDFAPEPIVVRGLSLLQDREDCKQNQMHAWSENHSNRTIISIFCARY